MVKYFLSTLLCFVVNIAFAQTGNMQLAYIHKKAKDIKSNIANLSRIYVKQDSMFSQNVYSNGKELVFVTVDLNDDGVYKHVEWYFSDEKEIYAEQQWTDYSGKLIDNEKFYFADWRLINWVWTDGSTVDSTSSGFKQADTALVLYGKKLETFYSKKIEENSK